MCCFHMGIARFGALFSHYLGNAHIEPTHFKQGLPLQRQQAKYLFHGFIQMKVNVDANFNCLLFVDLKFEITNGFEVKVSHFLLWYWLHLPTDIVPTSEGIDSFGGICEVRPICIFNYSPHFQNKVVHLSIE